MTIVIEGFPTNGGGSGSGGGSSFITPSGSAFALPNTHRALASVASGTVGDKKIALIGDSTTYGFNGPVGIGPALVMAKLLQAAGYPAALGGIIPVASNLGLTVDPRWTVGAGWTQASVAQSFGSLGAFYTGAVGAANLVLTLSGGYAFDTFDVYSIGGAAAGTYQVSVNGSAPVNIVGAGATRFFKTTVTLPAPTTLAVITFNTVSVGNVQLVLTEPSLSTQPTLRVANLGVSGSTSNNWVNEAGTPVGSLDALAAYAPDVVIGCLGINDAGFSNRALQLYLANLATITAKVQGLGADMIWSSFVPSSPASLSPIALQLELEYVEALPSFSEQHSCGYIPLCERWGGIANGYNELNPEGYYYDTVHPSQTIGYPDIGRAYADALLAA